MEDEDFLAAIEADNEGAPVEEAKEPQAPEPATPEPEQPAPAETALTEPATPTEPPVPTEGAPVTEAPHAPLAALLDERDKRKALEARIAQYERAQPQTQAPDPYEDPEGFAQVQEARVQQALYQQNLRWSEQVASIKHGDETVTKAKEWGLAKCDADPYFNAKVAGSPDPIGYVVNEFKRDQIASNIDDAQYQQFLAWKSAQDQLTTQPTPPGAAPPLSPAIPPRSLASAPSAGGVLTEPEQTDEDIFAETFKKE